MHEEHEGRLIHRIESFSDMVMGFSLALVGITLVVPAHTSDLYTHPQWVLGYFWTFGYIASVWFNHQRLFERIFVPTTPSITINFVLLSMLGLVVYFVQVFFHAHTDQDQALAFLGYFSAFSVSLVAGGVLYGIGTVKRWQHLPSETRRLGMRRSVRPICIGLAMLGVVVYDFFAVSRLTTQTTVWLGVAALAGGLIGRVALRTIESRVVQPAAAA